MAGMPPGSGTPMDWLPKWNGRLVNVHCVCSPEIAAERFLRRERHPGHLDVERLYGDVLESWRAIAELGVMTCGSRVEVDTTRAVNVEEVAREIRAELAGIRE